MTNPAIFREYDVRGTYGKTLFDENAYAIGRAFATFLTEMIDNPNPKVVVAYDGRYSSPVLETQLVKGLTDSGAHVVRLGRGPSPMLYFGTVDLGVDAGIMVTGSHNPKDDNGFKFMVNRGDFFGSAVKKLAHIVHDEAYQTGQGSVSEKPYADIYTKMLHEKCALSGKVHVVWDPGHGAAAEVATKLSNKIKGTHHVINGVIDGTFPAHHPDPTVPENLIQLRDEVLAQKADLGIAFDGDGDRIGVVDDEGTFLWGDQILMLLAQDVLNRKPGSQIIFDIKASKVLGDHITACGGDPILWKTGHSVIKAKLKETKAALAGEMSGHIFFNDEYFGFDDALYAALRFIRFVEESGHKLSDFTKKLPQMHNTPEIRLCCSEEEKDNVVNDLKAYMDTRGEKYLDLDGLRYETSDGWFLIRPSQTQAKIVIRVEALSEEMLKTMVNNLADLLKSLGFEHLSSAFLKAAY